VGDEVMTWLQLVHLVSQCMPVGRAFVRHTHSHTCTCAKHHHPKCRVQYGDMGSGSLQKLAISRPVLGFLCI